MLPLRSVFYVCLAIAASVFLSPSASAQLTVAVEASPDPVKPGEGVQLELVVANAGPAAANLVAELDVPAQVDAFLQTLASAGGVCTLSGNLNGTCQAGENVSWAIGTLGAGQVRRFRVAPQVAAATPSGSQIVFTGRVEQSGALVANDAATVSVVTAPVFDLQLAADVDPAEPGGQLTYTVAYGNESASAATNVTLRLPLPAGTTFVSATGGGVLVAGGVEWAIGTLSGTAGDTRRVTVQVGAGVASGSLIRATASITDTAVPTPSTARAQVVTAVQASPALMLAIEGNPDSVKAGETWLPQITVSNRSPALLAEVVIEATIPAGVESFRTTLFADAAAPSCPDAFSSGFCQSRERLIFDLGALAAGETRTIQAPFGVAGATIDGSFLRLDAVARATGGAEAGASALALLQDAPVFDLAVGEDVDPALPGARVTYTLAYGNESAASATNVTLRFPLPAGTSFVSASDGGLPAAGTVEWTLGTLSAGEGGTRQVTVQLGALPSGALLRATASISDVAAPTPRAARAQVVTPVKSAPPLELVVEASPDSVKGNETLVALVTVANRGAVLLDDVRVDLRIPDGVESFRTTLFADAAAPSCPDAFSSGFCQSRERLIFDLGALPAGATRTLNVPFGVGAGVPDGTLIRLEGIVSATDGGEAGAAASVLVKDAPVLDLAVDEDLDPALPGGLVTYVLTYGNESASAATNVTLRFPLPAGTSFVSATGDGVLADGAVTWALGTLAAGLGDTRRVTVQVGVLPDGTLLRSTASISDGAAPTPHTTRAPVVTPVAASEPLVLVVESNPDTVKGGETLTPQFTVVNRGATALPDVLLDVRLPDGIEAFRTTLFGETTSCPDAFSSGFCQSRERLVFSLGALAAGETRTVQMPLGIAAGVPNGVAIRIDAIVTATDGGEAGAATSVLVHGAPVFDLAVDEATDPVQPGGLLTYTLSFGNESAVAATNVALRFPLPAGTRFVSASQAGLAGAAGVEWALGTLGAGAGDTRRVTVKVDPLAPGSLLRTTASITDAAAPTPRAARATTVTAVHVQGALAALAAPPGGPLALALTATPTAVGPAQASTIALAVTNQSGGALADVSVEARLPDRIAALTPGLIGGTPTCPDAFSSGFCQSRERLVWALGALAAGETQSVSFPATVLNGTPLASHLRIVGEANALGSLGADARLAVRIGAPLDPDGDGVESPIDNCPKVVNPGQEDVGGIGVGSSPDGIGNACQCGDVSGDGRVTTLDTTLIQRSRLVPPTATLTRPDLCDVGGSAGCTASDAVIARRALLAPPTATIRQVCPADLP